MAEAGRQFSVVGLGEGGRWDARVARAQLNGHVRSIVSTFRDADADTMARGLNWYADAHDIAHEIGRGDVVRGAGVIAALSPQKRWDVNVDMARQFVRKGTAGHTEDNVNKARRIMGGEDPADVLRKGPKTFNFYHNILRPEDPQYITIDRHAHDVAVGQPYGDSNRGLSAMGRYNHFSDAYRMATGKVGLEIPNQVQGVTWEHWRKTQGID